MSKVPGHHLRWAYRWRNLTSIAKRVENGETIEEIAKDIRVQPGRVRQVIDIIKSLKPQ